MEVTMPKDEELRSLREQNIFFKSQFPNMFVEDMQNPQVFRAGSKHMNWVSKSSMSEEG